MATVISTCELERLVPDPEVGTAHRRLVGIGLTGSTTFLHGPLYSADRTSGTVVICDGPYVETKEFLGGFAVVDVADDEAAKMWAGKIAEACGWPHEVRRFKPRPQAE